MSDDDPALNSNRFGGLLKTPSFMNNIFDHAQVSSIRYTEPNLSANGHFYSPEGLWTPTIDENNIAYYTLFKEFNKANFLYPRPPIDMGLLDVDQLTRCETNVLRMPLKFPHTMYMIPEDLTDLLPLIQRVADYESFINKNHDAAFCHITFDKSEVSPGDYHRFPGFHGDGFQGSKLTPKIVSEHSYVVATSPPTEYCLQPFFLNHLDESKHNMFLEFDKQAKKENIYGSLPNHLYLIDPYMVHRTPMIKQRTKRLFCRITYTFSELEHPKNTMNPMFPRYEYKDRIDVRQALSPCEFEIPLNLYGLTKI